jgi:hypothetical protein
MSIILDGTTGITTPSPLILTAAALGVSNAGELEYDGIAPYFTPSGTQRGVIPGMQYYRLNSTLTGSNASGSQSPLGVGVTLSASTVYAFDGLYLLSKTAGATSHTFSTLFAGTATINNIAYRASAKYNTTSFTLASASDDYVIYPAATGTAGGLFGLVVVASATTFTAVQLTGTVSVNAGGTFIPQYNLSAAPGGAYTTQIGSYFSIYPIGNAGSNINVGTWA